MPDQVPERVVERIKNRINTSPEGCWIWPGATGSGYGRISWNEPDGQRWTAVHRAMYTALVGAIDAGLDLDHTCHDPAKCQMPNASDCPHRRCCNPAHLEPVTRKENLRRGGTIAAKRAAVTQCPQGHQYTPENTLTDKKGRRQCRTCTREWSRAAYWANPEKRRVDNKAYRLNRKNRKQR